MKSAHVGICKLCGKASEYKFKSLIKDYCSHKCSNTAKWETRKPAPVNVYQCLNCEKQFSMLTSTAKSREGIGKVIKYCSKKCMGEANKKPGTLVTTTCATCAKEFSKRLDHFSENNYCSMKCSSESQKTKGSIWTLYSPDRVKVREYMRKYWDKNREKLNQKAQEWARINRTYRNFWNQQRRAAGTLSYEQWKALIDAADGKCCVCGSNEKPQVDHILAVARGGKTEPGNLQVLCKFCNVSKGAKLFSSWLEDRQKELAHG